MDIDFQLKRIAALPAPDLVRVDGADLAQRAQVDTRQARMVIGSVMVAALAIGFASGLEPSIRPDAPLVPFGPPAALTPLAVLG